MIKNTVIIILLLLVLYLYYQNRKLIGLPAELADEREKIKQLKEKIKTNQAVNKTKLQQYLKDWQTNFPGKKRVLDSLEELVKTDPKYIEYKLDDFLNWLEEDESRKLGKLAREDWDETIEEFLQPSYAPPLYFQKYAEVVSICLSNEKMSTRTHKALWNWIQTKKNNSPLNPQAPEYIPKSNK